MDLFTSLLVKAFSGIMYLIYWLAFRLIRIVWWLSLFLLLSLGAGLMWLARGGKRRPHDTGRFGRYLEEGALWQDDSTGTVYPVSDTGNEYCEVRAEHSGQYWQRTMLQRLLRRGALWRYTFSAVTVGHNATGAIAGEVEFAFEAWKGVTLDHLDPTGPGPTDGIAPEALEFNRAEADEALKAMEQLLDRRGWQRLDANDRSAPETDPSDHHWYAIRFTRPIIRWDAPIIAQVPNGQLLEQAIEPADGQS